VLQKSKLKAEQLNSGKSSTYNYVPIKLKAAVVGNRFMNGEAGGAWLSQATGVAERMEGEALSVRSVPCSGERGDRCFGLKAQSSRHSPDRGV
jgi:hypothetical protein